MGGHSPSSASGSADAPNTKRSQVTKVRGEGGLVDFIKKGGVTGAIIRGVSDGLKKARTNKMILDDATADYQGSKTKSRVKDLRTGRDKDGPSVKKSIEQPKVKSQMDNTEIKSKLIIADKTAPTDIEMSDDERLVANKRGRKTKTVLTSITGDKSRVTLSKKSLLGELT
jgi:hypothetical protein